MPHKAHLLIVDDEANTLASLARAFRLAGHEATVCDNAAKGLELAKSQHFDLILSDVVMPGKDGLTLLEELKQQGVATPVVMMSGQAHIEMAVKATRLGRITSVNTPRAALPGLTSSWKMPPGRGSSRAMRFTASCTSSTVTLKARARSGRRRLASMSMWSRMMRYSSVAVSPARSSCNIRHSRKSRAPTPAG